MNKFKLLGFVGLVLLIFLIQKFGFDKIIENLASLKYYFILILIPSFITLVASGFGFKKVLKHFEKTLSFSTILRVKLVGSAFDKLLPLSWVGGDSVQFFQLRDKLPDLHSASSLLIDRALHFLGGFTTIAFSSIIFSLCFDVLPTYLEILVPAILLFIWSIITIIIFKGRLALPAKGYAFIEKLSLRFNIIARALKKLEKLGSSFSSFFETQRRAALFVLSMHLLGRLMGIIEIWLIMLVLGMGNHFDLAFVLAGMTSLLVTVFTLVPGQIGFMEASYGFIFTLFGYEPHLGVSIQLVRRLRVLFWVLMGVLLLNFVKGQKPVLSK